jgi:hypothetical protein
MNNGGPSNQLSTPKHSIRPSYETYLEKLKTNRVKRIVNPRKPPTKTSNPFKQSTFIFKGVRVPRQTRTNNLDIELLEVQQALDKYKTIKDHRANIETVVNTTLVQMRESIEILMENITDQLKSLEDFVNKFIVRAQKKGENLVRIKFPRDHEEFKELFSEFDFNMNYQPRGSNDGNVETFYNDEGVVRKFNKFVKLCEYYFGSVVHEPPDVMNFYKEVNEFINESKRFIQYLRNVLMTYDAAGQRMGFSFGLRKVKPIKRIKKIKSKKVKNKKIKNKKIKNKKVKSKLKFGMKKNFYEEERDTLEALKTLRAPNYTNGKQNINNLLMETYYRILRKINNKKDYLKKTITEIKRRKSRKLRNLPPIKENQTYESLIIPVIDAYIDLLNLKTDFIEIVASNPLLLTQREKMLDDLNGFIKRSRKQILSVLTPSQKKHYKHHLMY